MILLLSIIAFGLFTGVLWLLDEEWTEHQARIHRDNWEIRDMWEGKR